MKDLQDPLMYKTLGEATGKTRLAVSRAIPISSRRS